MPLQFGKDNICSWRYPFFLVEDDEGDEDVVQNIVEERSLAQVITSFSPGFYDMGVAWKKAGADEKVQVDGEAHNSGDLGLMEEASKQD